MPGLKLTRDWFQILKEKSSLLSSPLNLSILPEAGGLYNK